MFVPLEFWLVLYSIYVILEIIGIFMISHCAILSRVNSMWWNRIVVLQRCLCPNPYRLWLCWFSFGKVILLMWPSWGSWSWGDHPVLSGCIFNHKGMYSQECQKQRRRWGNCVTGQNNAELWATEWRQSLDTGKRWGNKFFSRAFRRNATLQTHLNTWLPEL